MKVMSRFWWVFGLRGIASVLFGGGALTRPAATLQVLLLLFGTYMLIEGIFALATAGRLASHPRLLRFFLLEGIVGVCVGLFVFLWPTLTVLALFYTLAFWALLTGFIEIVAAAELRPFTPDYRWLMLTGFASLLLGVALAACPFSLVMAFLQLVGIYALICGAVLVMFAWKLYCRCHHVPNVIF